MNIINKYVDKFKEKLVSKADQLVDSLDITNERKILSSAGSSPSLGSLSSFRNKLIGASGPARSNQFMVSFSLPSWMNDATLLSYLGVTQFNEELGLLCNKVTVPNKTLNTQSVKYGNNIERKMPVGYKWDEVTFTFIERNDFLIFNTFNEWIDGINNPITNTGRFYDSIISDVKINFLDKSNNIIAYYTLMEAYPIEINIGTLDWSTNNEYVSVDVTFNYIYSIHRDYDLTSLTSTITDFGSSDVINTLGDISNISWSGITSRLKNLI